MTDRLTPRPRGRELGRQFEKGRSGNPAGTPGAAATIAAVVDAFVRPIEISDFDRRLQLVEADCCYHPDAAAGVYGAGPGGHCNP